MFNKVLVENKNHNDMLPPSASSDCIPKDYSSALLSKSISDKEMSSLLTTEYSTDSCSINSFYHDAYPSLLSANSTECTSTCQSCCRLITDQFLIKISNYYFHESCAICSTCHVSLTETSNFLKHLKEDAADIVEQKCYERNGKLFCKTHYFNTQNRCAGCNLIILPDDIVYKLKLGIVYHVKCHVCCDCGRTLTPGEQILVDETTKTVSCVFHSQHQSLSGVTLNDKPNECLINDNMENAIYFPMHSSSYNDCNGALTHLSFEEDQPQMNRLLLNFSTHSPTTLMAFINDSSVAPISTLLPAEIVSTSIEAMNTTTTTTMTTTMLNEINNKDDIELNQFFENDSFQNVMNTAKFGIKTTELNTIDLLNSNSGNKGNIGHYDNVLYDKDNKLEEKINFYDVEEPKLVDLSFTPTENNYSTINFEPEFKEVKNLISSQRYSDSAFPANNNFCGIKDKHQGIQATAIADLESASYSFMEYEKPTNHNENINSLVDDTTKALNQLNNFCSTSLDNKPLLQSYHLVRKISHSKTIGKTSKANISANKKSKLNGNAEKLKLMRKSANPDDTIDKVLKSRLKKFGIFCTSSISDNESLPSSTPTPTTSSSDIKRTIKNDVDYNSCNHVSMPHYPFEMYAYGKMYTDADSKYMKRRGPRTSIRQEQLDMLNEIFSTTSKPSKHARAKLAMETGLNMRVIQVWFQNRRSKERRLKHLCNFLRHYEKNGVETPAECLLENLSSLDYDTPFTQSEISESGSPPIKNTTTTPDL